VRSDVVDGRLTIDEADNRRVLAVLRYLSS
jgi:hypothetical protein